MMINSDRNIESFFVNVGWNSIFSIVSFVPIGLDLPVLWRIAICRITAVAITMGKI